MPDDVPTQDQPFRLYTLHSQKGGVGKTSLAIAIACLEGLLRGVRTALIDADLTGTCLADALGGAPPSKAPRYVNDLILASPNSFLDLTVAPRFGRPPTQKGPRPDYWERYLLPWRDSRTGPSPFDYVPSNPALDEVRRIVPSLAQEYNLHFYRERLRDLIVSLATLPRRPRYRAIVLDLPPGLFGLSEAAFHLATNGELEDALLAARVPFGERAARAIVVATTDKMDYRATFLTMWQLEMERQISRRGLDPECQWSDAAEQRLAGEGEGVTPWEWEPMSFEVWFNKAKMGKKRKAMDRAFALGDAFRDMEDLLNAKHRLPPPWPGQDARSMYLSALATLKHQCTERGGVLPEIPGFSVESIAPTVVAMEHRSRQARKPNWELASLEDWVAAVAEALDLSWPGKGG